MLKAHRLALLRVTFAMETRRIGPESTPFGIIAGEVRDGNKEDWS